MKYSVLGTTGVKVSRICLGTATFGVAPTAQDADRVVGAAIDLGINFVDTADVYGNMPVFDRPGAPAAADREPAEQILGRALRGRRDEMVIATKSNGIVGLDINDRGLSRRHIIRQVETSLRRLETDYIDLYYAHDPTRTPRWSRPWRSYDDLIRQGKIRYVGLSNHPAWQVTHALWIADDRRQQAPVAAQVKYNLIDRAAERELAPACQQFGLSIIPYAPLHGGLLADLAVLDRDVAGDQRFSGAGFTEAEIAVAREVERLSRAWGLAPYQVSLAWLLSRPAVASAIVGAETVDELRANATAADVELEPAQLDALTALASEPAAFHHRAGDGPEQPPARPARPQPIEGSPAAEGNRCLGTNRRRSYSLEREPSPLITSKGTRYVSSRPGHHRSPDRLLRRHGGQGSRTAGLLLRRQHHPDLRQRTDHHRPRRRAGPMATCSARSSRWPTR